MERTRAGTELGGTNGDAPVRRPRTRRCDFRDVVLGGSWGGIEHVVAKTAAVREILEPIGDTNFAGNANRTEGTWDLTRFVLGTSMTDNVPLRTGISICVVIRVMMRMMCLGRGSLVGGKKSTRSPWTYRNCRTRGAGGKNLHTSPDYIGI